MILALRILTGFSVMAAPVTIFVGVMIDASWIDRLLRIPRPPG